MSKPVPRPLLAHALAVLLAASFPLAAQDEPAAGFEALVEVTEVLLDVLVADRDGNAVPGLGRQDFIVLEGDRPMEVTGASFYSTRYGPDGELLVSGELPSSRNFIFFFHNRLSGGSIRNYLQLRRTLAGRAARRWVDEQMLPSDWLAVVSYDAKLKIHHDFTQNRHALSEAIGQGVRGADPERGLGRGGRVLPPSGAPSLLRNLPQGQELRRASRNIFDGVRLLAEAAGFLVGRKNLVFFSIGFGGSTANGSPFPEVERSEYRPMDEALNDHNVAFYALDLTPVDVSHTESMTLTRLANSTGGDYYGSSINFHRPLERLSEEASGYYLLSYQSEHPAAEAGFQEVVVGVRGRGHKVRARRGYRYGAEGD